MLLLKEQSEKHHNNDNINNNYNNSKSDFHAIQKSVSHYVENVRDVIKSIVYYRKKKIFVYYADTFSTTVVPSTKLGNTLRFNL